MGSGLIHASDTPAATKCCLLPADNGADQEAERRMRQNMQRGIATRLHELSTEFRKVQASSGARVLWTHTLFHFPCNHRVPLQKLYVADLNKMASKSSIESLIGSSGSRGAGGGDEDDDDQDEGMSDAQMSAMANMQEDADERVREIQV